MAFVALIVCLVLFIMVANLGTRVKDLERKLQESKTLPPQPPPTPGAVAVQPSAYHPPPLQRALAAPNSGDRFVEWLKDNWLLKLGALLLLMGFGWLVTYAFLNNWIGPMGRIALGLSAGALILALGSWRMRAFVTQGS